MTTGIETTDLCREDNVLHRGRHLAGPTDAAIHSLVVRVPSPLAIP